MATNSAGCCFPVRLIQPSVYRDRSVDPKLVHAALTGLQKSAEVVFLPVSCN